MKMTKPRGVELLNMSRYLVSQSLRNIRKSLRMFQRLTRIQQHPQIIRLETLLIHLRPIRLEPRIQLLQMKQVLAAQLDRVPLEHGRVSHFLLKTVPGVEGAYISSSGSL